MIRWRLKIFLQCIFKETEDNMKYPYSTYSRSCLHASILNVTKTYYSRIFYIDMNNISSRILSSSRLT